MPRPHPSSNYHSFLLRIWRDDAPASWRLSLQSVHDEQLHYFIDLDAMLAHVQAELNQAERVASRPSSEIDGSVV